MGGDRSPLSPFILEKHGIRFRERMVQPGDDCSSDLELPQHVERLRQVLLNMEFDIPTDQKEFFENEKKEFITKWSVRKKSNDNKTNANIIDGEWQLAPHKYWDDEQSCDDTDRAVLTSEERRKAAGVVRIIRSIYRDHENGWTNFWTENIFLTFQKSTENSDNAYSKIFDKWSMEGNFEWTDSKDSEGSDTTLPYRTGPKPDITYGFPIFAPDDFIPSGYADEDCVSNLSYEFLKSLRTNEKLRSAPTKGLINKSAEKLYRFDLMCFPWAVVEIKPAMRQNDSEEKLCQECYCQAANAAAVALGIQRSLFERAKLRNLMDLPPVITFTCVGAKLRVWLAYADGRSGSSVQMVCIWATNLQVSWGVISARMIVGNMHRWACRVLKPKIVASLSLVRANMLSTSPQSNEPTPDEQADCEPSDPTSFDSIHHSSSNTSPQQSPTPTASSDIFGPRSPSSSPRTPDSADLPEAKKLRTDKTGTCTPFQKVAKSFSNTGNVTTDLTSPIDDIRIGSPFKSGSEGKQSSRSGADITSSDTGTSTPLRSASSTPPNTSSPIPDTSGSPSNVGGSFVLPPDGGEFTFGDRGTLGENVLKFQHPVLRYQPINFTLHNINKLSENYSTMQQRYSNAQSDQALKTSSVEDDKSTVNENASNTCKTSCTSDKSDSSADQDLNRDESVECDDRSNSTRSDSIHSHPVTPEPDIEASRTDASADEEELTSMFKNSSISDSKHSSDLASESSEHSYRQTPSSKPAHYLFHIYKIDEERVRLLEHEESDDEAVEGSTTEADTDAKSDHMGDDGSECHDDDNDDNWTDTDSENQTDDGSECYNDDDSEFWSDELSDDEQETDSLHDDFQRSLDPTIHGEPLTEDEITKMWHEALKNMLGHQYTDLPSFQTIISRQDCQQLVKAIQKVIFKPQNGHSTPRIREKLRQHIENKFALRRFIKSDEKRINSISFASIYNDILSPLNSSSDSIALGDGAVEAILINYALDLFVENGDKIELQRILKSSLSWYDTDCLLVVFREAGFYDYDDLWLSLLEEAFKAAFTD